MSQMTFSDYAYSLRKRKTKREKFLDIMNEIIPWEEWVEFVRPYYPNGKRGRSTKGIEKMLRMYLLQISISSAMIFFFPSLIGSLFLLAIKNQPPVLFIFYHSWLRFYRLFFVCSNQLYKNIILFFKKIRPFKKQIKTRCVLFNERIPFSDMPSCYFILHAWY